MSRRWITYSRGASLRPHFSFCRGPVGRLIAVLVRGDGQQLHFSSRMIVMTARCSPVVMKARIDCSSRQRVRVQKTSFTSRRTSGRQQPELLRACRTLASARRRNSGKERMERTRRRVIDANGIGLTDSPVQRRRITDAGASVSSFG